MFWCLRLSVVGRQFLYVWLVLNARPSFQNLHIFWLFFVKEVVTSVEVLN